jgi:hypothetical protein
MKRVNILWLLLDSLFLIVFNLLFFMLGDAESFNASVWISYCFIHFAYIMLLLTPLFIRRGKSEYMYRRPPYLVTTVWFLTELVAGVTFILLAPETVKITIIIHIVLAAVFIAWLMIHLIANEHTADNAERRETELPYIKDSSAKLHAVMQQITDRVVAKKVERVYDLLHSSPAKSNTDVRSLEEQVINEIERLTNLVSQNETEQIVPIADKIYRLADERNRLLKMNNK